jgi:hypothetical protein
MRIGEERPRYDFVPIEPERVAGGSEPAAPRSGPSFAEALRGLGTAIDRGEALVGRAARGGLGDWDSGQLIALQAGIYRYSEAVDLVAKLADRASTAVKTVVSPH